MQSKLFEAQTRELQFDKDCSLLQSKLDAALFDLNKVPHGF